MTHPARWSAAEIQTWRSRLVDDLAAQGMGDDVAQRWLLKAIAAQAWGNRFEPRPTSWLAVHDVIQQIHDSSGLMPLDWRQDDPAPSDRLWHLLEMALQHCHDPLLRLAEAYGQTPSGPSPKAGGIYYTPWTLIERMVQHTVGRRAIAAPLRIIDPSCGCGAFLLMAGRSLGGQGCGTGWRSWQSVVERLHGVDVDAAAVAIARLMLWLEWADPTEPMAAIALAQRLTVNIRVGNALLQPDWSQWFPVAASAGGFDVVIGNPPYLDSETMTRYHPQWRQHCAAHYATATGNWDVFCVFVEQAMTLARLGGWVSLVVPNKLLSATYASPVRSLLSQHRLQWIWDYAQVDAFPTAAVYPVVFAVEKIAAGQPSVPLIPYQVMRSLTDSQHDDGDHSQQLWTGQNGADWCVVASLHHAELWQRIEQQSQPLGAIATVRGAATVSEAYALADVLQDGDAQDSLRGIPMVNSGIIDRYRMQWGKKPLRYLGQVYQRPYLPSDRLNVLSQSRYQQAQSPKLIVAGLTRQLEVAIDVDGRCLAAKSTSIILMNPVAHQKIGSVPSAERWMLYLLGILNSQLMNHYVQMRFMGNRLSGGYMRIGPPQLRQLPIMPWSDRANAIVQHTQQLLQHYAHPEPCAATLKADEQRLDDLVCQHYGLNADETAALLANSASF